MSTQLTDLWKFGQVGRDFAEKFYGKWVNNSIDDSNKEVVGYVKNNKVQGLISYDLPIDGKTQLGVLCLNEKLNIGIIGYALISYAGYKNIKLGCKKIHVGTSKSNQAINNIYSQNGFNFIFIKQNLRFFH